MFYIAVIYISVHIYLLYIYRSVLTCVCFVKNKNDLQFLAIIHEYSNSGLV